MKQQKHIIILGLMIVSIILLIVLQAFWLRSSYERAYFDLRRETNDLFRNTVSALRDSIIARNIHAVPADSSFAGALAPAGIRAEVSDSIKGSQNVKFQIYISSTRTDSVSKEMLKPLVARVQGIQMRNEAGKSFVVNMDADTLNRDSLRLHFTHALAKTSISAPFNIRHIVRQPEHPDFLPDFSPRFNYNHHKINRGEFRDNIFSDTIHSEPVRFNPLHLYAVSIIHVRSILLSEITPQILFSVFLTVVILIAFLVMYLNIRSQQRLMKVKNDFISNITHELKTPVATVSVAIEALRNFQAKGNPKLTAEYLDIAQSELNRLTLMTDKILKTSIFEDRGVDYKPEQVNLDDMLQQILSSMKLIFEKRKAFVTYEKDGTNFELQGGAVHLSNVIYNLLDNAMKYSAKDPVIRVILKNSPQQLTLLVKDQGIGIPQEYKKKIFEKFFRVPNGDVHNTKGYGLGLNYVASVVKSHGGKIEVESEVGVGSTFKVVLPK
ncbi:MAG TPA: HAMP domain-containing sensor histidine kinase [Ohtaekwangia sp.]|uniref:sensor histidine kinase n=1 Tax=Ohtaekwangia sp. TaxID=2066019 RepID=UPI002F9376DD